MGVHGLYGQWASKINGKARIPEKVSSLSFDLNADIHAVKESFGNNFNRRNIVNINPDPQFMFQFMKKLGDRLINAVKKTKPRDTLIICVDGPTPFAKIQQQRWRRMKKDSSSSFDGRIISPGTEFMVKLDELIGKWIAQNSSRLPPRIIYSPHTVKGEGEHKIMNILREDKEVRRGEGSHIISSTDNDVIFLSMLVELEDVLMMRSLKGKSGEYQSFINISEIKKKIPDENVEDLILLSSLMGNDFLPPCPSLGDKEFVMDGIINILASPDGEEDDRIVSRDSKGNIKINYENMMYRIDDLAVSYYETLVRVYNNNNNNKLIPFPQLQVDENDNYTKESLYEEWAKSCLGKSDLNLENKVMKALKLKNPEKITDERLNKMCDDYVKGMIWVLEYYVKGRADGEWYYPYHRAPMAMTISNSMKRYSSKYNLTPLVRYKNNQPSIVSQLISIMSENIEGQLPEFMQEMFGNGKYSDILSVYRVTSYESINEGRPASKNMTYTYIPMVPFLDVNIINGIGDSILSSGNYDLEYLMQGEIKYFRGSEINERFGLSLQHVSSETSGKSTKPKNKNPRRDSYKDYQKSKKVVSRKDYQKSKKVVSRKDYQKSKKVVSRKDYQKSKKELTDNEKKLKAIFSSRNEKEDLAIELKNQSNKNTIGGTLDMILTEMEDDD